MKYINEPTWWIRSLVLVLVGALSLGYQFDWLFVAGVGVGLVLARGFIWLLERRLGP